MYFCCIFTVSASQNYRVMGSITSLPIENPVLIFFIVLVIILLAPILLNRIRVPHIIGLIIAGVIIGPNGLNLLARDSSFEIFGNVGILYLMFLAGLEIDMNDFKKTRKDGIIFGLYTFLVPMILGTITSYYTLHLDLMTSILLASMYASHTLIAYPIISRYGISRSRAVPVTIAGTIFTVLGALIILAVISGMVRGDLTEFFWLRLSVNIIIYSLAILYIYPRLTRWFFKNYNDNVTQFIFILALVFLASYMAQVIGLEAILGAFFAGIVLNRFIPNVSPLMNRLEFVGNALFIPYFLIGVGMLIDLRVIVSGTDTLIVAINMSVVATLCKWIAAWLTQKSCHMTKIDRKLIFGLSNAQAAATLAAVIIGHDIGLFNEEILNGTIVMILVTCIISTLVTEKAARQIVVDMQNNEPTTTKSPIQNEHILIPIANPDTTENLINLALLLKSPRKQSPLYALHVTDDSKTSNYRSQSILELAGKVASSADTKLIPIARYDMNITSGIIHTMKERNITEVVLGLHHKANIVDTFFGAKIESLLKNTNKMILISKCVNPINTVTRIVIAVPRKAEYETGFARWIDRVANMAKQIGCRAIFYAYAETIPYLKARLRAGRYNIRNEFEVLESWDDFMLLANVVLDDDLFIVVSARPTSVSFNSDADNIPSFLSKYFADNNLIVLYPEQFGTAEPAPASFMEPMSHDMLSHSEILGIEKIFRQLIAYKKRWTHRNRKKKIEL